ncbi:stressosome-associated protein Prli42 [Scopulibacillus darangshiensis]|nr:stressosome-associated protein Prli42 [Scopulibacillus darangshiensis]
MPKKTIKVVVYIMIAALVITTLSSIMTMF